MWELTFGKRLQGEGVHMQLVLLTDHKLKAAAKLGSQLKVAIPQTLNPKP